MISVFAKRIQLVDEIGEAFGHAHEQLVADDPLLRLVSTVPSL